ncbi:MAG: EamA family transporter [Rhodospirillaceae bacterium]|jgi:drug/metabolite transporter (DMT)-like permease|nr:EamA family transporter [Rhodospirillaceae bacterium]MBT5047038.1 EamA family transporter [Rhodospirillaceae bacterium]MBT5458793.1 EamA family transporter [Rhodospirillaceae bacterium]
MASARIAALPPSLQATFWITLSGFVFTIIIISVRKVTVDLPVLEAVFFRSLFGLAFMVPWLIRHGPHAALGTKRLGLFAIRGTIAFFVTFLYFTAAGLIPIADLTSITFTRPIFGAVAAIIVLGEIVGPRRWAAIAMGFIGMLIIVRPGFAELNLGAICILVAVLMQTGNTMVVKILTRTEHPDTIAIYHAIFMLPLALITAVFVWQTPTLEQIGWLLVIGAFGILNQRMVTRAFAVADASLVLALGYLRLPVAALMGFIIFQEVPVIWVWIGGTLICGAATYIARREAAAARAEQQAAG